MQLGDDAGFSVTLSERRAGVRGACRPVLVVLTVLVNTRREWPTRFALRSVLMVLDVNKQLQMKTPVIRLVMIRHIKMIIIITISTKWVKKIN